MYSRRSHTQKKHTIVVNIGDLMAFWSGGRYKAHLIMFEFGAKNFSAQTRPADGSRPEAMVQNTGEMLKF